MTTFMLIKDNQSQVYLSTVPRNQEEIESINSPKSCFKIMVIWSTSIKFLFKSLYH